MHYSIKQSPLVELFVVILTSSIRLSYVAAWQHTGDPVIDNANHIFNAIHGSMRQWDSSLNHNGMSLFIATVPKGTELYHGGPTDDMVQGPEWLAFETDHAMNFARIPIVPGSLPQEPVGRIRNFRPKRDRTQSTISSVPRDIVWLVPGFLHRYVAKHDLRLLYIDGISAAKGSKGTLDSTDYLILNDTLRLEDEMTRARGLCDLATHEWNGLIEGFVRMESGFEVIMCSFDRSLDRTDVKVAPDVDWHAPTSSNEFVFHWLRGAAMRYDGIGGSPRRVKLDFENFVTAYAYPIDLFHNGTQLVPRLPLPGAQVLDQMRRDLKDAIFTSSRPRDTSIQLHDWSDIAAMMVQDYADSLKYLVTSDHFAKSALALAQELCYMTRAYVDNTRRNQELETDRCTKKYIPFEFANNPGEWNASSIALRAVYTVSRKICATLVKALWALPSLTTLPQDDFVPSEQITQLKDLVSYLGWVEWKKCRGCKYGEICMIPMFPFGSYQDYHHPSCRGANDTAVVVGDFWFRNESRARF